MGFKKLQKYDKETFKDIVMRKTIEISQREAEIRLMFEMKEAIENDERRNATK